MIRAARLKEKVAEPRESRSRATQPLEYRILLTATLCLLAYGAVMVYSASSARGLLSGQGGTGYLVKYVIYAAIGLIVMHVVSRTGTKFVWKFTPLLVAVAFILLLAVLIPGVGVSVNGARRWIGPGFLQFQPSEIAKLAIVFYAARLIATNPKRIRSMKGMVSPLLILVGLAVMLIAVEPDLGSALVISATICALLVAGGVPIKNLAIVAAVGFVLVAIFALLEPYRRERLTAFLNPWADAGDSGFQSVQGQIAIGSGGFFGVGLGQSVQKVFYLPEAHTDFILAVIAEELGVIGVAALMFLYGLIAYAGTRAAQAARGLYTKLLAIGLTSLILCQAILNVFAVLGLAPLTGVPLPFMSYGGTSLIVVLGAMGLLMSIASGGSAHLGVVRASRGDPQAQPDREPLDVELGIDREGRARRRAGRVT